MKCRFKKLKMSAVVWQAQPDMGEGKCDSNPLHMNPFQFYLLVIGNIYYSILLKCSLSSGY